MLPGSSFWEGSGSIEVEPWKDRGPILLFFNGDFVEFFIKFQCTVEGLSRGRFKNAVKIHKIRSILSGKRLEGRLAMGNAQPVQVVG